MCLVFNVGSPIRFQYLIRYCVTFVRMYLQVLSFRLELYRILFMIWPKTTIHLMQAAPQSYFITVV